MNTAATNRPIDEAPTAGMQALSNIVVAALALLIGMPTVLSSWSLYVWAGKPRPEGLGLPVFFQPVVPAAFDLLSLAFVGMVVLAVWRHHERPGLLQGIVWLLAGGSAWLQLHHSPYSPGLFAALALAGPFTLEVALTRWRRWLRRGAGEVGFGRRWLIDRKGTYGAWKLSILEGLSAAEALQQHRLRALLASLPEAEQVAYALGALAGDQPNRAHEARVWLAEHGIAVSGEALHSSAPVRAESLTRLDQPAAPPARAIERAEPAPGPERNGHHPAVNVSVNVSNQAGARAEAAAKASAKPRERASDAIRRVLEANPTFTNEQVYEVLPEFNSLTLRNVIGRTRREMATEQAQHVQPVGGR